MHLARLLQLGLRMLRAERPMLQERRAAFVPTLSTQPEGAVRVEQLALSMPRAIEWGVRSHHHVVGVRSARGHRTRTWIGGAGVSWSRSIVAGPHEGQGE